MCGAANRLSLLPPHRMEGLESCASRAQQYLDHHGSGDGAICLTGDVESNDSLEMKL